MARRLCFVVNAYRDVEIRSGYGFFRLKNTCVLQGARFFVVDHFRLQHPAFGDNRCESMQAMRDSSPGHVVLKPRTRG